MMMMMMMMMKGLLQQAIKRYTSSCLTQSVLCLLYDPLAPGVDGPEVHIRALHVLFGQQPVHECAHVLRDIGGEVLRQGARDAVVIDGQHDAVLCTFHEPTMIVDDAQRALRYLSGVIGQMVVVLMMIKMTTAKSIRSIR